VQVTFLLPRLFVLRPGALDAFHLRRASASAQSGGVEREIHRQQIAIQLNY